MSLSIQIITLFPELFDPFARNGLVAYAIEQKLLSLDVINLRSHAINAHGQVDDTPYGGGSGMILRPESAASAIKSAREKAPDAKVVLFTPRGKKLTQKLARDLVASRDNYIFLCPRYEGVDQRTVDEFVDLELSIGDYILMGGEVPAMATIEALTRLIPGVLNNPESIVSESFEGEFLEYPQYTKPREYNGREVPSVLLSGNHSEIETWRRLASERDTRERRPDLIKRAVNSRGEFSVALVHYPVTNKQGEIITSSITYIDIHDIARSSTTYGATHFYVVHPVRLLRRLSEKITEHWSVGSGAQYNPNRKEALANVVLSPNLDDVVLDIESRTGRYPKIITSSARKSEGNMPFSELRRELLVSEDPHLLLLGTGWGLAQEVFTKAHYHLEPIVGPTDYNHLSVRAAAAILFDKLFGTLVF